MLRLIIFIRLLIFTLASSFLSIARSQNVVLYSPDQKMKVIFKIDVQKENSAFYSISNKGEIILDESPLGFEFENQNLLHSNLRIFSVQRKRVNTSWKPVYGERNQHPDHYNEMVIELGESVAPERKFSMTFRAYNEGVAFKYFIQTGKPVTISRELTGFQFDADDTSWITHRAQAEYVKGTISKTGTGCERPYVIEMNPGKYVALGEAQLVDNPRMKFDRSKEDS